MKEKDNSQVSKGQSGINTVGLPEMCSILKQVERLNKAQMKAIINLLRVM
ncbi:MAG: hypothetical protein LBK62_10985 [Treponema sp.]|jgi:hypothetical protein|nr:hypothetical protein [Treponema sp.]